MPQVFPKGRPAFTGRPWDWQLARELDELLTALWAATVDSQQAPGTPTIVEGGIAAGPGVGPARALWDHQHDLNTEGAPGNVTAAASVQGVLAGVSLNGHTHGLDDAAVLYSKIQDISAASRLLGRGSAAGAGDVQELTLALGLALVGTVLSLATVNLRPAQITANQNDYSPGTFGPLETTVFVSTDASRNITGILATGLADGLLVRWINSGANPVVLQHENVGSAAANRLTCPGAVDLTVAAGTWAEIVRDATTARWRVRAL